MMLTRVFLGLFAPREGSAYRARARRGLSHFDRGTPRKQFGSRDTELSLLGCRKIDPVLPKYATHW